MLTHLHSRWFICFPKLRFSDQRKTPQWQTGLCPNKHGTWAYLKRPGTQDSYLFWTSVDTDKVGAGKTIPVLINKGNSFYISETTTATRNPGNKTNEYVAISDHLTNKDFHNILSKGQPYDTLQDAYDAYEKLLTENKQYEEYKDTLPKSQKLPAQTRN